MKKLVTSALAMIAGLALAVDSQNIVGYTTQAITADTYYMIGVQFENVGSGAIAFDDLITMTGVQAYGDGNANCAQILVSTASGYDPYYYITDAWDADDKELGHDAWAYDGYECTAADLQALGNGFWFKAPVAASGATITVKGQVYAQNSATVSFPAGEYTIIANPFPVDTCFADVTTTGVTAYDDGSANCAQILVSTASGYDPYYYITDAWDADDKELGYDAWAYDGYECEGTSVPAGASFWIKSGDAGTITFTL